MDALIYVVDTLIGLYLLVLLLRLLLQWSRADFRNPIARAIVQVTNPVIMPLRRLLPPIGRVDTASVVAVIVVASAKLIAVQLLATQLLPGVGLPPLLMLLRALLVAVTRLLLQTYFYAILLYAVLSFLAPGTQSPAQSLLYSLCEPVLRPVRRNIPAIAGIDLSALWVCIAIQAALLLLR